MSTGVHCEEGLVMNTLVGSVHRKFRGVFPHKELCCLSFANSCLLRSIQSETATDLSISLCRGTHVTCAFSSVGSASCKSMERRHSWYSELCPFIRPKFPSGMSQSYSGLAGSLSSSLHENYSMEEFKECGVHSMEQLAEHYVHFLLTASPQNRYEHSCTFTV